MTRAMTTAVLLAGALVMAGCQSAIEAIDGLSISDREDLRDDLVADGSGPEEADCMIDEMDRQLEDLDAAIEGSGGSAETFRNQNSGAYLSAISACTDPDEIVGAPGFREGFIEGATREDALIVMSEEEANCVFDALVASGANPAGLSDFSDPERLAQYETAVAGCGVDSAPDVAGRSDEELRPLFAGGFVAVGQGTQREGECIFDEMVAQGVPAEEFMGEGPSSDELLEAFDLAYEQCGLAVPDITEMSDDEIRDAFLFGFSAEPDVTIEQAACVFDGMVAAGVPPRDFAGDDITVEAETALVEVLDECEVSF